MLNNIIKIVAVVYFGVMTFFFFTLAQKWVVNTDTDTKIKKEAHIAALIGQYNADLNACVQETQNEGLCVDTMNKSNIAKLIRDWGFEDVLVKTP